VAATIRLLVTRPKCHPPIEGEQKGSEKKPPPLLAISRRGWRAGSPLALHLGLGLVCPAGVPIGLSFVKTVLNNLWTHIGYEDDGRLVHTDKKTGIQFLSVKTWPSLMAARQALDADFSKIEWEELKEPPPGT
jgi:hypothetical protein